MFALRKITEEQTEMNIDLGKSYTIVHQLSKSEFDRLFNVVYKETIETSDSMDLKDMRERVYAFVTTENGFEILPIFRNHKNYIMTESGKTFSKI